MKAKLLDLEQGSHGWLVARIPFTTSSKVATVMAKGGGATRANYMATKVCEILTGEPVKGFKSKSMQEGNDREAESRELYQVITGNQVQEVGFAFIEEENHGSSSDGLVDEDGMIEIKNVLPAEQIRLLTTEKIKPEYVKQMQDQMYVYDRKWCDFVQTSFGDEENGELPDKFKVKIIRVFRDEEMILSIRKEVAFFHHDLQELLTKLKGL